MFITLIKIVFELIGGRFNSGLATVNDYTSYNYSGRPAGVCLCRCVCVSFHVFVGLYLSICVWGIIVHCDGNEGAIHWLPEGVNVIYSALTTFVKG